MFSAVEPEIQRAIDQMEAYRKEALPKAIKTGMLYGFGFSAVIFVILLFTAKIDEAGAIAMVVLVISLLIGCGITISNYYTKQISQYKGVVMPMLVNAACEKAKFNQHGEISYDVYRSSSLFSWYSSTYLRQEDYVQGIVDRTDFEFCEATLGHVEVTRDKNGKEHRRDVTDFKGLVFTADFNKSFNTHTILCPNYRMTIMHRIKMESVDFNKQFHTYCEDEQEARYILTPALQERILNLQHKLDSSLGIGCLMFSFYRNRLAIFAPTYKNHFEPPMFSRIKIETVKKDYDCIQAMVDIIENLNLNTRIWTKQ